MAGTGGALVVRGTGSLLVDVGDDPPLSASGKEPTKSAPVRVAISWRWLAGTVLTGVTSIVLVGVALIAALNGPGDLSALPVAQASAAVSAPDPSIFGQKGDRIRAVQAPVASRQVIQVSTVTRQGNQDLIKLTPFAKISTSLVAPTDQQAKQIPAFDMSKMFDDTDASSGTTSSAPDTLLDNQFSTAKIGGDVTVKESDLPADAANLDPAIGPSATDAEMIVQAASQSKSTAIGALALVDAGPAAPDPGTLAIQIATENVSNVAKTDTSSDGDGVAEKVVTVAQAGDLGTLIAANGVAPVDVAPVVMAMTPLLDVAHLKPGQKVRLGFEPAGDTPRLLRASIYQDGAHLATVARADDGSFVRADEPATPLDSVIADGSADAASGAPTAASNSALPTVYDAVYATALQQQMPPALVEQLVRIFAIDIDMQSRIAPGDSMEVFHSLPDPTDASDSGDPEILFASLTLGGTTKRFYRYRTGDDGAVDYYDETGKSAKKFLLRKPVTEAVITSGFGYRIHPILHTRILHTGVDYAAPKMTPIFAAGDGVIEQTGYDANGYGNFIIIKHNNGYETLYGHQTKYADGIKVGVPVHQGQIIGYVGSTGLSTGPHVHFEIRINGTPVDPLRVRLPEGRVLADDVLTQFEAERQRIDNLLGIAPPANAVVATK